MEFSEGRKDTPGRYKRDCDLSIIEWSILKQSIMEHTEEEKGLFMGKHSPYTSIEDGWKKKIRSWEGDSPMRQSPLLHRLQGKVTHCLSCK